MRLEEGGKCRQILKRDSFLYWEKKEVLFSLPFFLGLSEKNALWLAYQCPSWTPIKQMVMEQLVMHMEKTKSDPEFIYQVDKNKMF